MDGTFVAFIRKGVEVELLIVSRDHKLHILLAVDTALAGGSVTGARASGVVKAELLDVGGNLGVCEHEATEGRDSVEGDFVVDLIFTDGDSGTAEVGVRVARGIGELDLGGIGHRGVAIRAVAHDHQEVVALSELEGGSAEIGFGRCLVGLLDAGAIEGVNREVQACAGFRGRDGSTRKGAEGGLLDAEDGDTEVFVSGETTSHSLFVSDGLLTGKEEKECA